jgi:hypothetical protein
MCVVPIIALVMFVTMTPATTAAAMPDFNYFSTLTRGK